MFVTGGSCYELVALIAGLIGIEILALNLNDVA
jgi:hypothetical protein